MGNEQSMEQDQSVRVYNGTEMPLVVVIGQTGPLYWEILQPGQRWTKQTGRVWFTLKAYPYTGDNTPTDWDVFRGIAMPIGMAVVTVCTAGYAAIPAAGTAAAALAPIVSSAVPAIVAGAATAGAKTAVAKALDFACQGATKTGHYANGDWVHIHGGPRANVHYTQWRPIQFFENQQD